MDQLKHSRFNSKDMKQIKMISIELLSVRLNSWMDVKNNSSNLFFPPIDVHIPEVKITQKADFRINQFFNHYDLFQSSDL